MKKKAVSKIEYFLPRYLFRNVRYSFIYAHMNKRLILNEQKSKKLINMY